MIHARSTVGDPAGVRAEYFDFSDRSRGLVSFDGIRDAVSGGTYVWIDVDSLAADPDAVVAGLPGALTAGIDVGSLLEGHRGDDAASSSKLSRHDGLLHLVLIGGTDVGDPGAAEQLDVLLTAGAMLTIHRGSNAVLAAVRQDYVHDFERHATTPSFLLYEIFNEQVEQFLAVQNRLEDEVEETRIALRSAVDEPALHRLGDVSGRLLALRTRAISCRRVLEEIVSRKTTLVSDATLSFLDVMILSLDRLLGDIASNREILESALDLSLTVMSHRTSQSMNRLAVVSTIFLPLTFLCGIYGMNFAVMPEIGWHYGYLFFWVLSGSITFTLVWFLRRSRLL